MKHQIKYFICAIAVTLMFTACDKDIIDPLSGKYPPPEEVTLTSVGSKDVVKQENGTRLISLQLNTASASFTVDFVVNTFFLRENAYTLAPAADARNGNYISAQYAGNHVTAGVIDVKLSDESAYTISGILQLANNTFINIFFTGEIIFEADPPEYVYTLEVQKPYAWTADGTSFTPVAGSQLNIIDVYADGALAAHFELVTGENPASYSGTYPVSGEIRDANGAVVQGMYMDLSAFIPDFIIESGSYLAEDNDKLYLFGGNLTIVDNGGTLTFTGSDFSILDKASGFDPQPLPGVQSINYSEATKGGSGGYNGTELTKLLSFSAMDLSMFGGSGYNVTVKLATDGLSGTDNGMGGINFTGSGNYISIDFRRDAATLTAGTYNIVPDATAGVGDVIAGYPAMFGEGNWGSVWGTVTSGAASDVQITGGVVTVSVSGDVYTIEIEAVTESGNIKARYTGKLSDEPEPEPEEIELTKLLSFSVMDLSAFGGSGYNVTVKLATDEVSGTDNGMGGIDFTGTGNYLSVDFRRDAATLAAGAYNIVPDASAGVGDAIAGYPAMFGGGNWGSVWGTVTSGAASDVQITEGVVTVSVSDDVYTIEIEAATEDGAIKATYTGSLE